MRFSWSIPKASFADSSLKNDLGVDRASSVTAADFVRNSPPVNVLALEHGRAFRRPGTAAYTAAQENRGQLSAWASKCAMASAKTCAEANSKRCI